MDYPHPLVTLDEVAKSLLEGAYDVGIGDWDKRAVIWGYQDFPDGKSESEGREAIIRETLASGLRYVADEHARIGSRSSAGPVHPAGSLWDNGSDPVAELNRLMALRKVVLANFSERAIQPGRAMATLEDVLFPHISCTVTRLRPQPRCWAVKHLPTPCVATDRRRCSVSLQKSSERHCQQCSRRWSPRRCVIRCGVTDSAAPPQSG